MRPLRFLLPALLLGVTSTPLIAPVSYATPVSPTALSNSATPQPDDVGLLADALLQTDRRFAAAGARTDMVAALAPMFSNDVRMPTPTGFAIGKTAVVAALRASPTTRGARVAWHPIRVGLSADGTHGFTFGYMAQALGDSSVVPLKYMAYWVREPAGWRVVAYKRTRSVGASNDSALMAPVLPARLVPVRADAAASASRQRVLMNAEQLFSDDAQRVGLGNAYITHGRADAVNMGGTSSKSFVVGAAAIAQVMNGGDLTSSPARWSADTAIVATSDDLGISFGILTVKNPPPGVASGAGIPFFTIWYRESPRGPWRYIAE